RKGATGYPNLRNDQSPRQKGRKRRLRHCPSGSGPPLQFGYWESGHHQFTPLPGNSADRRVGWHTSFRPCSAGWVPTRGKEEGTMRRLALLPLALVAGFLVLPASADNPALRETLALQEAMQAAIQDAEPAIVCILVSRSDEYVKLGETPPANGSGRLGRF